MDAGGTCPSLDGVEFVFSCFLQILVELLKRSFHGVNHEVFRPVVLCVLEHLPVIHDEYLSEILKDEQLFRDVSVPVKRQIWQDK